MDTKQSGQIFQLIPKIMKEVGAIEKSRRNPQQGYAFRGIDDLYNAIQGHFAGNGVFCVPEVVEQMREERETKNGTKLIYTVLRVRHTFYAGDGSNFAAVTVGEAMDTGDKSANKAMSAAMKYALIEVFAIPTEGDNDTENNSHELAPALAQRQEKPASGLMDDAEFAKAMTALESAWQEMGISSSDADKIVAEVLKKKNVGDLRKASRQFFRDFIKAIKAGKFARSAA